MLFSIDIAPIRGEESVGKTVLQCSKSFGSNLGYFSLIDSEKRAWKWELNFQIFDYSVLILLLLTLCPLSFAVAQISRGSDSEVFAPLNARNMWRQTGRKALAVLLTPLLYVLIMDVGSLILWVAILQSYYQSY